MADVWKREMESNTGNPEDGFTAYRKISYNEQGMTAMTTPEAEAVIRGAGESVESFEFDNRGFLHISQEDLERLLVKAGYELSARGATAGFNGAR